MKQRIQKQIEKIVSMLERIEEYNNYLDNNTYSERHTARQLSYGVKLYVSIGTDDVEEYCDKHGIQGERRLAILEEFDTARLEGIYYHWHEDQQQSFIDDEEAPWSEILEPKNIGFYGRSGGHLCLGDVNDFKLEISDTEANYYPIWNWSRDSGSYWSFNDDIQVLINEFKDSFGVTTQKEVLERLIEDSTKGDIKYYYDKAIENQAALEKLEESITEFKKNAQKYITEYLHDEIENFIQEEYGIELAIELAESGNYSKLDDIKDLSKGHVLTTRNAAVKLSEAKQALKAILRGKDITGQKIGAYTVNEIRKTAQDTYIKIGCHLFSLNQTLTKIHI